MDVCRPLTLKSKLQQMKVTVNSINRRSKILAISFNYAPANAPRAVQVARLLKHSHFSSTLICAEYDPTDDRVDPNLVRSSEEFLDKCLRVPFSQPTWKKLARRLAEPFDLAIWDKAPDRYRDWNKPVLRAVHEHVNLHDKPEVIITFGSPMSDHLIGLELKARYGLPWLAHFSDPWCDNPFKKFNWLTGVINRSLERDVIESADRVVFTSDETVDLVMRKYSQALSSKARVLPHAFEPNLYATQSPSEPPKSIRYVGDLYGPRTPEPLFRALTQIYVDEPELLSNINFEFVGGTYDLPLSKMGLDELPDDLVSFRPTVSYQESLAMMTSAAGLLVIDAPAAKSVFLPSKLVDYIGAGRPILGITPLGTTERVIGQLGGWVADPSDINEVQVALKSFLCFVREGLTKEQKWGKPEVRASYEASKVAKDFEKILGELL
jgi:hypothetical protein